MHDVMTCPYVGEYEQLVSENTALRAALERTRATLTILYELNESGNVGGAVYEEAMDLAMDALRDTERIHRLGRQT